VDLGRLREAEGQNAAALEQYRAALRSAPQDEAAALSLVRLFEENRCGGGSA
jgi:hypothetical protein